MPEALLGPLRIEALANGGTGIARDSGRVIFVPHTAPGDLIRARLAKDKKRYAEAQLVEVLEPSPLRRPPPCPVAGECGGCQWQHLPYAEQLRGKQQLFNDSLQRQLNLAAELLAPIVPSPSEWHYRSRVQVKCHLTRNGFVTGFFRPKSHFVVAVESCPILAPELNQLLAELRQRLGGSPFAGQVPQLDLAIGDDGRRRAVVHYLGAAVADLAELLALVADADLFIQCGRKDNLQSVRGDGELRITVDRPALQLTYAVGGFAQVNLAQNRQLVDAVLAAAGLQGHERVLDLYCGMGNFSLPLARRATQVCGVEDYAPSIAMARRNAVANGVANVEFHARPAEGALSEYSRHAPFDLLLLDPPRTGAYAVMKELLDNPVAKVIYVSCDPQTMIRDLQPLVHGGYRIAHAQPFDMFPQTFHTECLVALEYAGGGNVLAD